MLRLLSGQPPSLPSAPFFTSAASSAPLNLTPAEQSALAQSAQSSGYSLSQAISILQTARDQALPLTAPYPEPSSCVASDHDCAFLKACYPCYATRALPVCLPCLRLQECQGVRPCEMEHACKVCQTLPAGSYTPAACHQLHC